MKYFLFLDESGDHGLAKFDPDFPVFLLCGVLIKEDEYEIIRQNINNLKHSIWDNKEVIIHSRDIRKCEKEFQKLFNLELKKIFYEEINTIVATSNYNIIASAIQKEKFVQKFGKLQDDIYEIALSFVIEQAIVALQKINPQSELAIIIERRGKKEDKQLDDHFQKIQGAGTGILSAEQIKPFNLSFTFRNKKENINGLQLADLVAYPIARYIIEPNRANPAFEVFESKIFKAGGEVEGVRIYP
ncbi:DUF3800 domain-containing protein [Ferruginibacter sp. HRS2-29]|uniref:DUF3800 domain-containing protein n=1 Tax=Ferruginibacter sp. HRS2-29 TaxID=2487334 RepID=UPI0020CE6549|nr:DUF3800 domain-containing protein [Ferruginibacter sp. HRS2-29]MCP9752352.1 DUF3800 domain-containing protein [Ferruginibacter sp. HRS2-29]